MGEDDGKGTSLRDLLPRVSIYISVADKPYPTSPFLEICDDTK